MYVNYPARRLSLTSPRLSVLALGCLLSLVVSNGAASAQSNVIRNITQANERMELTVNSSRILTLDKRIPKMVVNNPELVTVTALSANQVQLAARKPGVTQINLWDEDDQVYTLDVMIYGDVKELEHALDRLFPGASVKVVRLTNSLVLEGFVERPEDVSPIVRLAEDYAPKIVNNITVGGVQQVLLKVKVMEVSRTKLRRLGFDFAYFDGSGSGVVSSISEIIQTFDFSAPSVTSSGSTAAFGIVDGDDSFFGFLDALQQNNVAKILADPTLTAVSGRPAHFNVGGELPIIIPSGLGQTTVEYKKFGTQVDFVPIVLGNGNIRLEVRPRVSEIDETRGVQLQEFVVPALRVREVDTGVELKAGQTLALAGLVQTRVEGQERGLPFLGDLPYVGAAFRQVVEEVNEIELLIMVTPEYVDGMDPHEVPPCGPGMESVSPTNCQLYFGGHLEVPACGPCAPENCGPMSSCGPACYDGAVQSHPTYGTDGYVEVEQGMSHDALRNGVVMPAPEVTPIPMQNNEPVKPVPGYENLLKPTTSPATPPPPAGDPTAYRRPGQRPNRSLPPTQYSRYSQQYRTSNNTVRNPSTTPGLIGPIGYDND